MSLCDWCRGYAGEYPYIIKFKDNPVTYKICEEEYVRVVKKNLTGIVKHPIVEWIKKEDKILYQLD